MKKETLFTVIAAILVFAAGVLCTVSVQQYSIKHKGLKWEYGKWRKLSLILDHVERNYVDTIDVKSMTEAAISAALAELDPHSVYLPPVELEESETELSGNFEGIGISFNVPNDTAVVLNVIPGGPSEKAGLLQGDRIIKVNDRVIAGTKTPQDSMVRMMKGPSGTNVKIGIKRDSEEISFDITRDRIPVNSIDASFMVNDTTGYIKLSKFSRTTHTEFIMASAKLLSSGMTKLLFDLRDNSGGYLDQAYLLCNEFLKKDELIVYMDGLHRSRQEFKANGKGILQDIELIVLIDEASASSSEIFAGAMQDNDRGTIVGRRSFGKGLVQEPINFTDGSGIRLTVARYHTPSGRCIQKPYTDDYAYDIYNRYTHGELTQADSIKVDDSEVFYTVKGRKVYGGGGIVPDVFVPIDTTRASNFFVNCNKKATTMRFASSFFDSNRARLSSIENQEELDAFIRSASLESKFLDFARTKDGFAPESKQEWEDTRKYMMPQVNALVARYSKLGEDAFYKMYLPVDDAVRVAMGL